MTRNFAEWHNIKTESGNCSYAVIDGTLIVRTPLGIKTHAPFDGIQPERLAHVMLWEILSDNGK
jgi:hypothetical protein